MSFSAVIPNAQVAAANALLEAQGFGPGNFSVPIKKNPNAQATHMGMHSIGDAPALEAAVAAIPGVQFRYGARLANEFAALLAVQDMVLAQA